MNYSDHIVWLANNFGQELLEKLQLEGIKLPLNNVIDVFVAADPSSKKGAVDWLVKTYIHDGFLWEDIQGSQTSKVYETLEWFAQYRKSLEGEARNLGNYTSLAKVYTAIQSFICIEDINEPSGKEIRKQEREKALQESIEVWRSNECIVAVPLTQQAAQWWGRGTRWCTAAENNNYFSTYNRSAPLIVAVFPQGLIKTNGREKTKPCKFQLWANSDGKDYHGSFAFMNEADEPVNRSLVEANWDSFKPLLEWAVQKHEDALAYLPFEQLTKHQFYSVLRKNPYLVKDLKSSDFTQELCEIITTTIPEAFRNIPDHFRTVEFDSWALSNTSNYYVFKELKGKTIDHWQKFITENLYKFEEMPVEYQTQKICSRALKYNFRNINCIANDLLNEDMILNALQKGHSDEVVLDSIPSRFRSENVLCALLKNNPREIQEIPAHCRTERMLVISISADAYFINNLENHEFTPAVVQAAIKNNKSIINMIPPDKITQENIDYILQDKEISLSIIPKKYLNKETCKRLIAYSPYNIHHVPKELIDEDIAWLIVKSGLPNALRNIPVEMKTKEICMYSFEKNQGSLIFFPDKWVTPELVKKAFLSGNLNTRLAPSHLIKESLLMEWIQTNPRLISNVCRDHQTKKLCMLAINLNPNLLPSIHLENRTIDVCIAALTGGSDGILLNIPLTIIDSVDKEMKARGIQYAPPVLLQSEPDQVLNYQLYHEEVLPQKEVQYQAEWHESYLDGLIQNYQNNLNNKELSNINL